MKILQIVGGKKTGKTTTMLDFLSVAKEEALTVSCLKHAHEAVMDTPGTDSYKFAAAGADEVVLTTPGGTLWHQKKSLELPELLSAVEENADLVLIEGFRAAESQPRLTMLDNFQASYNDEIFDFSTEEKRKEWFRGWLMN